MMSLIQVGVGLGSNSYNSFCDLGHPSQEATCTILFLLYEATSVLLLLYMLIAMIIRTFNRAEKVAERQWRRRWVEAGV